MKWKEWKDVCPFCMAPVKIEMHSNVLDQDFYEIACGKCPARMADTNVEVLQAAWNMHHIQRAL